MQQYKFDIKKFRLGMRTFKTGLAVFIVLTLFYFLQWEGLQIAALTAVFSLREDFDTSLSIGYSRIFGNTVGAALSLIFYFIRDLLGEPFWITLVLVPILTMLTIMINVACGNKLGVIGSVAALLIITLSIPQGDTLLYALARVIETFVGVFVAIMVNADVNKFRDYLKIKGIIADD